METNEIYSSLNKIGITLTQDTIVVTDETSSRKKIIDIKNINKISLIRGKASLVKKIIFWAHRILTFNNRGFTDTPQDDSLDYRLQYLLTIELKDETTVQKHIKDFNLFKVAQAINQFNESLEK